MEGKSLRSLQGSNPRHPVRIASFTDDRDPGEVDVEYRDACTRCGDNIIIIIIIIFVYCNWVVTRWQWLFYMYTKHEIGY